jgi:hypothetical protein
MASTPSDVSVKMASHEPSPGMPRNGSFGELDLETSGVRITCRDLSYEVPSFKVGIPTADRFTSLGVCLPALDLQVRNTGNSTGARHPPRVLAAPSTA